MYNKQALLPMSITDIFITKTMEPNFVCLLIKRHDLAVLHASHTGLFKLLVLTLIMSDNMAQIRVLARGDIVGGHGIEADPISRISG